MCEESGARVCSHGVDIGRTDCIKQSSVAPVCTVGKGQGLFTLELVPKGRLLWALSLMRKIQIEVSGKEHHLCSYIWEERKHPLPVTTTKTGFRDSDGAWRPMARSTHNLLTEGWASFQPDPQSGVSIGAFPEKRP